MAIGLIITNKVSSEDMKSTITNVPSLKERCLINREDCDYIVNVAVRGHFNSVILEEVVDFIYEDKDDIDVYVVPYLKEVSEEVYHFLNYKYPQGTMDRVGFESALKEDGNVTSDICYIVKNGVDIKKANKFKFIDKDWWFYEYI